MKWHPNKKINKECFFNQYLLKALKLLVFVLFSFFTISNIMVKTFLKLVSAIFYQIFIFQ